jgi:HD superfamily phosphohydrolase
MPPNDVVSPLHELDERTRSVLDPIHGLIRLTENEMQVVDHPLFQRLRNIKQNGLLHLIFPAATHTRFEHSLGVLYVAHGMLNSLTLNSKVGLSKGSVHLEADAVQGQAVAFPRPYTREWKFIYRITRLAALAHDLGHGPLSHTFDSFAPKRVNLDAVLRGPGLAAISPLREFMLKWGTDAANPGAKKNRRVPHEIMSCVFFAKIWDEIHGEPEVALAVCASILGDHDGGSAAALIDDPLARAWAPLIHDVVASAPADADRMDYMERDSKSIGVTYGLFDRNRVLKSLLCYRDPNSEVPIVRLGVKSSGLQAIENLMQARYELFVQVYYHKTNRAISRMLDSVSEIADGNMDLFGAQVSIEGWIAKYLDLSDDQFFRLLRGNLADYDVPSGIRDIAENIQKRRLWKRILDPTTSGDANAIRERLSEEFPAVAGLIKIDDSKPKALKDLDSGAALLIRGGSGAYAAGKTKSWSEESRIIAALSGADEQSSRIYFESTDETTAKLIRSRALQIAFERKEVADAAS